MIVIKGNKKNKRRWILNADKELCELNVGEYHPPEKAIMADDMAEGLRMAMVELAAAQYTLKVNASVINDLWARIDELKKAPCLAEVIVYKRDPHHEKAIQDSEFLLKLKNSLTDQLGFQKKESEMLRKQLAERSKELERMRKDKECLSQSLTHLSQRCADAENSLAAGRGALLQKTIAAKKWFREASGLSDAQSIYIISSILVAGGFRAPTHPLELQELGEWVKGVLRYNAQPPMTAAMMKM